MIHTRQLRKQFTSRKETVDAVKGVEIDIDPGELVAFLGPNGAGKTTTLRMLTTLLPPTSGTAEVAGADIVSQPALVRSRIGYIGQGNGGGHSFRVLDELHSQGRFYGLRPAETTARAAELVASLDLTGLEKRTVGSLSGGQRRRLDVALGLMNSPKLLFLDEPSTGMDPQNRANLWAHIRRLRAELGTTIVLTTHYLEEADAEAERVVVIDHGEIIADDTAEHLKNRLAGDRLTVVVDPGDRERARSVIGRRAVELEETPEPLGVAISARVDQGRQLVPVVLRELDADSVLVRAAEVRVPTLDDVFLSLTGRSLREDVEVAA
ncbi:MAG TPA: ATP-binding cassette domain-containing protein [Microlunatus sp.]|nr:ATP-binding cassette domain-containing protein [Microlunatus sp.]